jgi:hypothetical protein
MKQMNMLEEFSGEINRLCRAVDIKNWTDSNHCYDIAEDTLRQVENTEGLLLGLTDRKYVGRRVKR